MQDQAEQQLVAPAAPEHVARVHFARPERARQRGNLVDTRRVVDVDDIQRIEGVARLPGQADRIEQDHLVAHLPAPSRRDSIVLALRIDHDDRTRVAQQRRDDAARSLARTGRRDGDQVALAVEQDRVEIARAGRGARAAVVEADRARLRLVFQRPADEQACPFDLARQRAAGVGGRAWTCGCGSAHRGGILVHAQPGWARMRNGPMNRSSGMGRSSISRRSSRIATSPVANTVKSASNRPSR